MPTHAQFSTPANDFTLIPFNRSARGRTRRDDMVQLTGGRFRMGSDKHYPEEAPAHEATVDAFLMDRHPVTNNQFARFVHETDYVTSAERVPRREDYPGAREELLVAASVVFRKPKSRVDIANHFNWWTYVPGACWRHPLGPRSTLKGKGDHPVVHIAYEDAEAYARWAGKSLPTEAEWEYAARGGLDGADFAWGDSLAPGGIHLANTWQGEFPYTDLGHDGYEGTSPVSAYPPNAYGLFDMIGNVWEWTCDWYEPDHMAKPGICCNAPNARGGRQRSSYDPRTPEIKIPRRVMKGGSYLCAPNYCQRYRPAARMAQMIDTSTCHLGFRCVVREA